MTWTEDRIEIIVKGWEEGLSATQIAHRVNVATDANVSRNAVIGKIHRLGLAGRAVPAKTFTARGGGTPRPMKVKVKPAPFKAQKAILAELPVEPFPTEDTPPEKLIAFADLEEHHCRWIYGDPKTGGHGFCGQDKVIGLSYCTAHSRRAFAAPTPSRRKELEVHVPHINKVFA